MSGCYEAARVKAARTGARLSDVIEEAVRRDLGSDLLKRLCHLSPSRAEACISRGFGAAELLPIPERCRGASGVTTSSTFSLGTGCGYATESSPRLITAASAADSMARISSWNSTTCTTTPWAASNLATSRCFASDAMAYGMDAAARCFGPNSHVGFDLGRETEELGKSGTEVLTVRAIGRAARDLKWHFVEAFQ